MCCLRHTGSQSSCADDSSQDDVQLQTGVGKESLLTGRQVFISSFTWIAGMRRKAAQRHAPCAMCHVWLLSAVVPTPTTTGAAPSPRCLLVACTERIRVNVKTQEEERRHSFVMVSHQEHLSVGLCLTARPSLSPLQLES